MLLLRVGRLARWGADRRADDRRHVDEAVVDLTLSPDEAGLSVYRIAGDEDAREVALRFALTSRQEVQHMDYLVFPSELATSLGLSITFVPIQGLEPQLNARHLEIAGLTPELVRQLAAAILASNERRVARIRSRDLLKLGAELCRRDPELKKYLMGEWVTILGNPVPEG
jgi:hypothetical protein